MQLPTILKRSRILYLSLTTTPLLFFRRVDLHRLLHYVFTYWPHTFWQQNFSTSSVIKNWSIWTFQAFHKEPFIPEWVSLWHWPIDPSNWRPHVQFRWNKSRSYSAQLSNLFLLTWRVDDLRVQQITLFLILSQNIFYKIYKYLSSHKVFIA